MRHWCWKHGKRVGKCALEARHSVTVWNRTASKCEALKTAGAMVAESVAEAIGESETIIACLTDHAAFAAAVQTPAVASELKGKTFVQLSTVAATESTALGEWVNSNGAGYLDGGIFGYRGKSRSMTARLCTQVLERCTQPSKVFLKVWAEGPVISEKNLGIAPQFDKAKYACFFAHTWRCFKGPRYATQSARLSTFTSTRQPNIGIGRYKSGNLRSRYQSAISLTRVGRLKFLNRHTARYRLCVNNSA